MQGETIKKINIPHFFSDIYVNIGRNCYL